MLHNCLFEVDGSALNLQFSRKAMDILRSVIRSPYLAHLWKILEKLFLTDDTLRLQLEQLDNDTEEAQATKENGGAEVEVTEMNDDQLTIEVKERVIIEEDEEESEGEEETSADQIEVVCKPEPKLQGILKQRTVSESSDDIFSSASLLERQTSSASVNGSESTISESDENADWAGTSGNSGSGGFMGRRKCVSFSEHDDKITYKSGQSVCSMQSTLKSKRRRTRKKEARSLDREEKKARRRRTSSGSESTDDLDCSLSSPDAFSPPIRTSGPSFPVKTDDAKPVQSQSRAGNKGQSGGKTKQGKRAAKKAKNATAHKADEAERTRDSGSTPDRETSKDCETTSADYGDIDDDDELSQSTEIHEEASPDIKKPVVTVTMVTADDIVKPQDTNSEAVVTTGDGDRTLPSNQSKSESATCDKANELDDDDDSDTDAEDGRKHNGEVSSKELNGMDGHVKADVKHKKPGEKVDVKKPEKDEYSPETMLSWEDKPQPSQGDDHKTKCAFEFSNQVMFDLDED